MEHQVVDVSSGIRIAVQIAGETDAPAMVLLHALGDRADDWAVVAEHFARSHRVVAIDLRGHGRSDWPGEYTFELMRDDVIGVLDALGLADITLIGHSMGGTVALLIAEAEPGRIARLVIEDSCPPYPRDRTTPTRPDGPLGFDWEVVTAIGPRVNDPSRRWWPPLADITAPTLVVAGGPTSHVPQELLVEMSGLIPECELVTIAAGHNVHAARPAEFVEVVEGWLSTDVVTRPA
ncbi:alpha/beta fold hydrolase [Agromyces sp. NPDC058110]|uniref:alpha/beta fold hydrolase n=1 Tax=Agromyces sp. NPDC058110 TaxID=3346345 RepID=UPI0036DCB25D